jgi:uncharacterized protein (TIGR02996 family)
MTDREALVRAIIERPDDDAPRLIFADWLDENGEPERAEFIRIQCELANKATQDDRWRELVARADDHLRKHGELWTKGPATTRAVYWRGGYYRGFRQTVAADTWADMEDAWSVIFSSIPVVHMAVNSVTAGELDDFLSRPETRFLRSVHLNVVGLVDDSAFRIARFPAVTGWGVLRITSRDGDSLTGHGAQALIDSHYLGGLYGLHLPLAATLPEVRRKLWSRFGDALAGLMPDPAGPEASRRRLLPRA